MIRLKCPTCGKWNNKKMKCKGYCNQKCRYRKWYIKTYGDYKPRKKTAPDKVKILKYSPKISKAEVHRLYEINCDKRHELRQAIVDKMQTDKIQQLVLKGWSQEQIDELIDTKFVSNALGISAGKIRKALWSNPEFKKLVNEERNLNNIYCEKKAIVVRNRRHNRLGGEICMIKGCGHPVEAVKRCQYHYHRYRIFRRTGRRLGVSGRYIK